MKTKEPLLRNFRNNVFAIKTIWSISKSRVILNGLEVIFGYASWLFFSIFFMRYIIGAVEDEKPFEETMFFLGISFIVFASLSIFGSFYESMTKPFTENKIYRILYRRLYNKARNVELRCFEDAAFYSKYTMALENSVENMTATVSCFLNVLVGVIAAAVGFSAVFLLDNFAILFVVFPLIGNFFFGHLLNKVRSRKYADNVKYTRRDGYVNRVMHLAEFAKEVRFSNVHRLMMKRYHDSVEGILDNAKRYAPRSILYNWFMNITIFCLPFEGIMIYAAYRALVSQSLGLAELAVMFSAMVSCSWILINLFGNVTEAMKNGEFLKYFRGFMEYEEKIPEDSGGIMPSGKVENIEFRNVSFEYVEGQPTIKNLSFIIAGEKIIAFVGHNGAGKTTIVKLLFRLYDPTEGDVFVNGINIKEYNLKAYRKLFAAAFQDYKVMSLSVKENVLMGVKLDNADEIVEKALKRAGIWDKIASLPNGINTILTKEFDPDGAMLSGGEVQKIIAARAFALKSPVQVFDEPSSALDPIAEYQLYKGIMKESKEHDITIFISHRLSSVKDADLVFMLEDGTIIEQGTHRELMVLDGAYCEMFTMQAKNYLAVENYTEEGLAI